MELLKTITALIKADVDLIAASANTTPLESDLAHRIIDYAKVLVLINKEQKDETQLDYSKLTDEELEAIAADVLKPKKAKRNVRKKTDD